MRWRNYLRYTAILLNGLLVIFMLGNGGWFWSFGVFGIPVIAPPIVAIVALVIAPHERK